jgi:hypothetical protein
MPWLQVGCTAAVVAAYVCTYCKILHENHGCPSLMQQTAICKPSDQLLFSNTGTAVGELVEVGTIEEADLSKADKEVVTTCMCLWCCASLWLRVQARALRLGSALLVHHAA